MMYVDLDDERARWWFSSRMGLAILVGLGFVMMSSQKVSMELAMACMLNESLTNATIYRDITFPMDGYMIPRAPDQTTIVPTQEMTSLATTEAETTTTSVSSGVTEQENVTFPAWFFPPKAPTPRPCGEVLGLFTTNYSIHHFKEGDLDWGQEKVDMVMSTYYWGYVLSQFPSGWLAERFGSRLVFGVLMAVGSLCQLVLPVVAHGHYFILLLCRFLAGVGAGVALPATHALWGRWAVPHERSQLISISYSGIMLGHVVTFPLVSFLCRAGIVGGWPAVFYILGGGGVVWSILWLVASQDNPLTHPRIAKQEKRYILLSLNKQTTFVPRQIVGVPWLSVVTSLPVLSVIACTVATDWLVVTLNQTIPDFMRHIRIFDIRDDPVVEGMPFAGLWLVVLVSGWCADRMQARGALNTTHTRKLMQILGTLGPCATVIAFGFLQCHHVIHAVVMLICAYAFTGFAYSGFLTNHLDLAPRYAGITLGLANTLGAMAQQAAPVLSKSIIVDGTQDQWQTTMFIAASLYLASTIMFIVCGSGNLEPWAVIDEPLPDIPERQNDPSREPIKRSSSVRRSPSKRGDEEAGLAHRRGVSLKSPSRKLANRQDSSNYTMDYLSIPQGSGTDGVLSGSQGGTLDSRRKTSDNGDSNNTKRKSGSSYGAQSSAGSPTQKTPPVTIASPPSDGEFYDAPSL